VGKGGNKRFCLVLVKPSHYDDDGYVIQWLRSPIPSTSLAALYGLAKDCAERHVLGPDVEIDVHAFDETNTRIRCNRLAAMIQVAGAGMVMLVGVQSNQFPRALDLAKVSSWPHPPRKKKSRTAMSRSSAMSWPSLSRPRLLKATTTYVCTPQNVCG